MDVGSNPRKYFFVTLLYGASLLHPVTTLFFLHRGLNYSQMFLLFTVIVITMFFFEIPTGIIGDKYGRKFSIICGGIGYLLIQIGLLFAHSFWAFTGIYFLIGVAITFISGSDEALIFDSLKQKRKQKEMKKWMGKIHSAKFIPLVIIAPIGSIIAKDLSAIQFIILISGSAIFSLFGLMIAFTLVEPRASSGPHEIRSPTFLFKSAVKHIRKSPKLVRLFINKTLIVIPGSHVFAILWQPYLKSAGVPVALFGSLVAASSLMIWLSLKKVDKLQNYVSEERTLFLTSLLPFSAFLIGAISESIVAALIFYFLIKICVWLREPIFSHYMNQQIKSHNRATVLSSLSMVDSLFDVIIFVSAGLITDLGIPYAFVFSASVMLIGILFFRIRSNSLSS